MYIRNRWVCASSDSFNCVTTQIDCASIHGDGSRTQSVYGNDFYVADESATAWWRKTSLNGISTSLMRLENFDWIVIYAILFICLCRRRMPPTNTMFTRISASEFYCSDSDASSVEPATQTRFIYCEFMCKLALKSSVITSQDHAHRQVCIQL